MSRDGIGRGLVGGDGGGGGGEGMGEGGGVQECWIRLAASYH